MESVILEEDIDENYEPTEAEIEELTRNAIMSLLPPENLPLPKPEPQPEPEPAAA